MHDDEHSGRSNEQIMKVSDSLKNYSCVSARLIKDMAGIRKITILRILTEDLKIGRSVQSLFPHSLNGNQKIASVSGF